MSKEAGLVVRSRAARACNVIKAKYPATNSWWRDARRILTDYSRLQVHEHSPGDVLARPGLAEKGVEGVVPATNGLIRGHPAVWLDTVLQTVELPAGIADLHSGLSNVDRDDLTLLKHKKKSQKVVATRGR